MKDNSAMRSGEPGGPRAAEATQSPLLPAVDIYEDATGITIKADLPGVSRERLSVQVDNDTLTIEGEAQIQMPEGMEALYADMRTTRFRRSFSLSRELESGGIDAQMQDGVLTLRVPRREETQPRKIQVRVV